MSDIVLKFQVSSHEQIGGTIASTNSASVMGRLIGFFHADIVNTEF